MSKRFYWDRFNIEFLQAVVFNPKTPKDKQQLDHNADVYMLVASMDAICSIPDYNFVMRYRQEIEDHLFARNLDIAKQVIKRITHIRSIDIRNIMRELRRLPASQSMLDSYVMALMDIGNGDTKLDYASLYRMPMCIDMRKTIYNDIPLYDFQKDAVKALDEAMDVEGPVSGMLVMPTGSGKTRTATYFLLRDMISNGYQVIWLTHRHMLVDQAADAFCNGYPLIKKNKPNAQKFSMICISGEHSSIRMAEKTDDVIIVSVQSGFRSLEYIGPVLGKKVIVVIDEAHHAVAKSYKKIVDFIRRKRHNLKLLGLTATPIRGTDRGSVELMNLFNNNIIYNIPMAELVKQKVLADPRFELIETHVNFEPKIDVNEAKLIRKYGELPASLVDKVAQSAKRNSIIVDTYMKNRERYGKTLIFALNIQHCYTLCLDLQAKGVKCDYIYSGRDDNERIIKRFQSGELDVLVNINILTEGSDVPQIKTVFLTRPTQSEGLLVQMIGRGLRGPKSQGTAIAYIVDFCDKWDVFNKWLNPEFILSELEIQEKNDPEPKIRDIIRYPLDLIKEIYKGISYEGDMWLNAMQALPCGWYNCKEKGEDNAQKVVLVFDGQLKGYQALSQHMAAGKYNYTMETNEIIMNKFFGGFDMPPHMRDVDTFTRHWIDNGVLPPYYELKERDEIDPSILARQIKEDNIGFADIGDFVQAAYTKHQEIVESLFDDFANYYNKVLQCAVEQESHPQKEIIELMPLEQIPFDRTPYHDLDKLVDEVIQEMFGGRYDGIESVSWTDRPYQKYYGVNHGGSIIRINSLLNSKDVPEQVLKYLIYHEMLHRDYRKHTKEFRAKEHLFPDYVECDRFLDNRMGKFKFEY